MRNRVPRPLTALLLMGAVIAACDAPGGPKARDLDWNTSVDNSGPTPVGPTTDAAAPPASAPTMPAGEAPRCAPVRSASPLPATATAISSSVETMQSMPTLYFTSDLFGLFKSQCGACHVETKLGSYQVTAATFTTIDADQVVNAITSDDPAKFMPPAAAGGKAFSKRTGNDPVLQLLGLFKLWAAQGKPRDAFSIDSGKPMTVAMKTYLLSPDVGAKLTNIGNCVPNAPLVASDTKTMDDLDAKFAQMTELPESLDETDLTTLDGETLARDGLVAYAPTYPLWTDDAGKLRHVRVPRGQAIAFDKAKQQFQIPANTRFYKTFLREIVDRTGTKAYRKIETRVIVSRPDSMNADGTAKINALFGTYIWNDAETEAHLLRDPLRNGQPFRDRIITLVIDEPKAQRIRDAKPPNLIYALETENTGVIRHYSLPGRDRCIQCHMGSPSASFILGFTPLQVLRRPDNNGGVYESSGEDELTQLQRLIDYKVISGMTSPADVADLESSQGTRKARNQYELDAQAYMVGNCSHCHNPRGFPSVKNPALRPLLNFLPSTDGGIFQFPLDRTSPRLKRGPDQNVLIPYITPSLREYPVGRNATDTWKPKWIECGKQPDFCMGSKASVEFVDAPWRSLIYRNVDTPFTYVDDYVVFPHMPMNSPGYDCRVAHLMADWMVSIPAKRKAPEKNEDAIPVAAGGNAMNCATCETNAQPYLEVKPGEPDYDAAVADAAKRLDQYRKGRRYQWCPNTSDIIDPEVGIDPHVLVPKDENQYVTGQPGKGLFLQDNVPDRPHFVITDLTDAPGDWFPRRPDWADVLLKGQVNDTDLSASDLDRLKAVVDTVRKVNVTEAFRSFALTEVPFGGWAKVDSCDFRSVPKGSQFSGAARPRWMDNAKVDGGDPVYTQSPGGAVFNMICINCHGPLADAQGIQANAVLEMTGGETRVANLRDGLFGPVAMPGANLMRVFGVDDPAGTTGGAEDWGARYMAWMAMGGTKRIIPQGILNIVKTTKVLDQQRPSNRFESKQGTPNMLQVAQELCHHVLPALTQAPDIDSIINQGAFAYGSSTALIDQNGDAELWQSLCSFNNRAVVRVPYLAGSWTMSTEGKDLKLDATHSLYWADGYPADAPVLDQRGQVVNGVKPDNLMPLCIRRPDDPAQATIAQQFLKSHALPGGATIPFCPSQLFDKGMGDAEKWLLASKFDEVSGTNRLIDADLWASRGAINAGFSVFLYLEQIEKGAIKPKPAYNQCDQLPKSN